MLKTALKKTAITLAITSFSTLATAQIVTSIKPLAFIASAVAEGVTSTEILVPTGASPHDYHLKPSDREKLKNAELVLWIGEDVDEFLEKSIDALPKEKVLTISDFDEIKPLLVHQEDEDEHHHNHHHNHAHKHKHDHDHDHDHDHSTNWHLWYSADISQVVAKHLAQRLSKVYPQQKTKIEQNLAEFNRTLTQQQVQIKQQLSAVKNKGFYVFHDAYSYFNQSYGLNQVGYFTINPLVAPGAKTLNKIKREIKEHKVNCLFAEPQFTPKVIESLRKATGVKVGKLDPMGDKVQLGKNAYVNFLQYTADSYLACLK